MLCVWGWVGGTFINRPFEVEDRIETCVSTRHRRFACNRNVDFSARKKRLISVIIPAEILIVRNLHKKPDCHVALEAFLISKYSAAERHNC